MSLLTLFADPYWPNTNLTDLTKLLIDVIVNNLAAIRKVDVIEFMPDSPRDMIFQDFVLARF